MGEANRRRSTRKEDDAPYLLNEAQALVVLMATKTDTAAAYRHHIIDVFRAYLHGELKPDTAAVEVRLLESAERAAKEAPEIVAMFAEDFRP